MDWLNPATWPVPLIDTYAIPWLVAFGDYLDAFISKNYKFCWATYLGLSWLSLKAPWAVNNKIPQFLKGLLTGAWWRYLRPKLMWRQKNGTA